MEKKINRDAENRDECLRELFAASKLTAGENLKYRIMQQIQTENLLAKTYRRKEKQAKRQIGSLLTIAAIAYVLIMAVIVFGYLRFGIDLVMQTQYYLIIACIVGVAGLFGFISFYDEKLREKKG